MSLLQTMLPATIQNFAATTALDMAKNNGNSKSSWIDNISKYINGASGWLNKGVESANTAIGGLLDKGALNAEKFAPTSLAMGLGKSAVNATLGAFGNNPADIHSTAGKITQGIENSGILPMLGPVGAGLQLGFTAFNTLDNALGKTGIEQGTVGMDIAGGYGQNINNLAGKKFSWTSNSKRKRSDKLTKSYMEQDLKKGFTTFDQNQNSLAATNTTGSLFNKNALQKQGGLGTGSFLAKKGGTINPAQLRNIVYKAQKGAKLKKIEKDRSIEELVKYANEANPSFINRLQTNDTRAIKFKDDEGNESQGTHYLEWGTNDSGKAIVYPRIQLDGDSLKFFNSDEAYNRALNGNHLEMTPSEAELFTKEYKNHYPNFFNAFKFKEGGKMNVIPEGALHARKHDLPEEIAEQVTKKGIPVVTEEEGGKLTQHAEIERDEIIFHKEATNTIEDYFKKYNEAKTTKEKDKIALECGKYLTSEILTNTDDRTGLLEITK